MLLETCSDTRVSNGITQLTTKYNALLSLAKEVMKRLELHYQVFFLIASYNFGIYREILSNMVIYIKKFVKNKTNVFFL